MGSNYEYFTAVVLLRKLKLWAYGLVSARYFRDPNPNNEYECLAKDTFNVFSGLGQAMTSGQFLKSQNGFVN